MELVSGNIFIRKRGGLEAGNICGGHTHNFDHTTIVFTGAVRVRWRSGDGLRSGEQEFKAPNHFLVKADCTHEITALEDGTEFWCVYSHRTPQGEVVQEHIGWTAAYG